VIGAFHRRATVGFFHQASGRQGCRAVGTDILDPIDLALTVPSQKNGFAEDFITLQLAGP